MLRADDLTFSYHRNGPAVLDGVSFTEEPGRLVAVLGANGSGKSTLFRCLLGFERNYSGGIFLDGTEIRQLPRKVLASRMAYVPQAETSVFNYPVFDTVLMGTTGTLPAFASPAEEQTERAESAIRFLGIGHLADRGVNEISGGERQLTLLARAIAQQAKILILDEPTANLDYGNQQLVLRNARRMAREGYTILFSTHDPAHALQYADRVMVIRDRKVAAEGETSDVLTEDMIRSVYGLETRIVEIPVGTGTVKSCVPVDGGRQETGE
ncbi:MAG: ABC transporter ATP-binding protein [Oscillospiraceae bacterium]|nr:ABC transporter ATP-binding protein [Oscillospiraceae bacterium]